MGSIAGRFAQVKVSGTPTAFTDEAVTVVTTNKVYRITNTAKRVWSPTATITVSAGGTPVNATLDPYVINRLTGLVTFTNVSARGTVTLTGTYLPMAVLAKVKSYSNSLTTPTLDDTTFDSLGWTERIAGIHEASASLGRNWESVGGPALQALIVAGSLIVVQFFTHRSNAADLLMWSRVTSELQKAATTSIVEDTVELVGFADADERVVSIA